MCAHRCHEQGLPVRRRIRHCIGSDRTSRPTAVINDHNRLNRFTQHLRKRPGHNVSRPARWKWHNDPNLFGELCGSRRKSRDQANDCCAGSKTEKLPSMHLVAPCRDAKYNRLQPSGELETGCTELTRPSNYFTAIMSASGQKRTLDRLLNHLVGTVEERAGKIEL